MYAHNVRMPVTNCITLFFVFSCQRCVKENYEKTGSSLATSIQPSRVNQNIACGCPTVRLPKRGLYSRTRLPQRLSVLQIFVPCLDTIKFCQKNRYMWFVHRRLTCRYNCNC